MVATTMKTMKIRFARDAKPVSGEGQGGSLRIAGADRRVFPRKELTARCEGKRLDHTLSACKQPHLSLSTRDISVGGLSAISDVPLDRGERVSVFFPPHGIMRGWDAYGRVVRCEQSTMGYRVALEFESLPAA
jgi:hypothetical protein